MQTNPIYLAPFQFFGLRESPFHVSPDLRYYMTTAAAEETFVEFCYGIEMRKGLLVLTAEPGTGKTTLLHRLLQWLRKENKSTSYVFHYHVNPDDLLQSIFQDFGIAQPSQSKSELLNILSTWLIHRNAAGDFEHDDSGLDLLGRKLHRHRSALLLFVGKISNHPQAAAESFGDGIAPAEGEKRGGLLIYFFIGLGEETGVLAGRRRDEFL